jgi:hypothetical protein
VWRNDWRRGVRWFLPVLVVLALSSTALAGDPKRYADRDQWPAWAATYFDNARLYPKDGELVDAIRYELIRGYPVDATDFMHYEDRAFRPDQAMTRAEFAAVLSRSQGLATADGEDGVWYAPYITVLQEKGIIPAGAGTDWDAAISRREAGQWMGRAADLFRADDLQNGLVFEDVSDPLILRALRAGIVKGTGTGHYEPDRALLRSEAAVMLLRLARARNADGNAENTEVITALQDAVKAADRWGTETEKHWMEINHLDRPDLEGLMTVELGEAFFNSAEDAAQVRPNGQRAYTVDDESSYVFTTLEVHATIADIVACGLAKVYRATDPPDRPWFEQKYCGRQFLILRDGRWILTGAADVE